MARPRKFNREKMILAAMQLFWRKGYALTSIEDLEKEVGIKRGSLYADFKSKEDLFLECIDFYRAKIVKARKACVEDAATARDGIEAYFRLLAKPSTRRTVFWGCLNTNTAIELSHLNTKVSDQIKKGFRAWTDFWKQQIDRGIADKTIQISASSREVALALVIFTQGLNVYLRSTGDKRLGLKAIRVSLNSILGQKR